MPGTKRRKYKNVEEDNGEDEFKIKEMSIKRRLEERRVQS